MQKNIGAEVLRCWNVESEQDAMEWIQRLAARVNGKEELAEEWNGHEQQS